MIKLKQIKGGNELYNDVEFLKELSSVKEMIYHVPSESISNVITLPNKPSENKNVELEVNGVSYHMNKDFTVDFATSKITWILSGFRLDSSDVVAVHYSAMEIN